MTCHVYAVRKQVDQVLDNADVLEHANQRIRLKLDHDVDIARGFHIAARNRAEQRRMLHAAAAKLRLVRA